MTQTRIFLTVLDEQERPYRGVFDSAQPIYPKVHENGALLDPEKDWLIAMAKGAQQIWLPSNSYKDPVGCTPHWLVEALWVQIEPGPCCYYKFTFEPPLEIIHALPAIDDPSR